MEQLIAYLRKTYDPVGVICYGSYRDGSQNEQSDFDALVLTRRGNSIHDTSICDGVRLDVFVSPVAAPRDPQDFIQIYDGVILADETGAAAQMLRRVRQYVDEFPKKTAEEKLELKSWCEKMLLRASRTDAEGLYRGHWLLTDSLQIYCEVRDRFYFGPKKTILRMEQEDPEGFALLRSAMEDRIGLQAWINYIFENQ